MTELRRQWTRIYKFFMVSDVHCAIVSQHLSYSDYSFQKEANIGAPRFKILSSCFCCALLALFLAVGCCAQTSPAVFEFLPAQSSVAFTLGDTVHTVHGSFFIKRGKVTYNASTAELSGEVVLDATTAHSGNGMRDRKMHKEVLESAKYPEIIFRPDHVDAKVGMQGTSTVQVHGIFTIHGGDHEMTVPVQVDMASDHWTATGHFVVPYATWGMKNPSTFILRVSASVEIDVHASGPNPQTTNVSP